MLKEQVLRFINNFGYSLIKHQIFETKNYGNICKPQNKKLISIELVNEIFDFYKKVPPFYSSEIIKPLQIEGAWKNNLEYGRKNQIQAIKENAVDKYKELLDNMFCNEMIYAMWEGRYFNSSLIDNKLTSHFLELMDAYKYLTGRKEEDLYFDSIGNPWGYKSSLGIIKTIDPAQGVKAQNILNLLNFINPTNGAVVCDIGSGFGGDMEKLARWYKKPLRIILVDIPLNLTTAYAYISSGFADAKKTLVKDEKTLKETLSNNFSSLEFIFMPTIFVDSLKTTKINVVHNHGSFSEMDKPTIDFYLKILLNSQTDFMIEVNSNKPALLAKSHIEVASSNFNIPETHCLLSRTPTWLTPKGHRYLNSVYVNRSFRL